ncbi:hemerythrin domain-containing protein [Tomitella gaofuii]|uniref:hemerythrin domain-containing protein n=1 Tax=Tomitella gaofuii TaxID=2760083 RepID=UPI0015FDA0A5|nr:hemerythrin domain-containing protein [Tomitella gaofuii]
MNALEMLREDHDAVIGMLDKLRDGAGGAEGSMTERKRLATALVIAESRHEAAEERVVWPVVRRMVEGGDALADAAIKQESDSKALLRDIDAGDAGSAEFERALAEFDVAAREHIEFEETLVWPSLRETVNGQQLAAMGNELELARWTVPTRPHPRASAKAGVQKTLGAVASAVDRTRDRMTGRHKDAP